MTWEVAVLVGDLEGISIGLEWIEGLRAGGDGFALGVESADAPDIGGA